MLHTFFGVFFITVIIAIIIVIMVGIATEYSYHKSRFMDKNSKIGSYAQFIQEFNKYPWEHEFATDYLYVANEKHQLGKWFYHTMITDSKITFNGTNMVFMRVGDYIQYRLFLWKYLRDSKIKMVKKALGDKWDS